MKKYIFILLLLIPAIAFAVPPTRQNTFSPNTTIRSNEVNQDLNDLYGYLFTGVDNIRDNGLDTIGEIDASLRTGSDQTLVTGTQGSTNDVGVWNADGDIVGTSGLFVYTASETKVQINGIMSASNVYLTSTDCSGLGGGGKITTDSNGRLVCAADGQGSGSSKWTESGTDTYLTSTTNDLIVGGTSAVSSAKVSVDGDADQIQALVQGNATQTSNILVVENSAGSDILTANTTGVRISQGLDATGWVSFSNLDCTGNSNGGALTTNANGDILCSDDDTGGAGSGAFSDAGDPVVLNTSTKQVTIGSSSSLAKLAVDGDADEVQALFQANATQTNDVFVVENSAGGNIMTANVTDVKVTNKLYVTGDDIGVKPTATITVCAANARGKLACDYVCDATNDEVQIQQAINAGDEIEIYLSNGAFYIENTIWIQPHQRIRGAGINVTKLFLGPQSPGAVTHDMFSFNSSIVDLTTDCGALCWAEFVMEDITAFGRQASGATGKFFQGGDQSAGGTGELWDVVFQNVVPFDFGDTDATIDIDPAWGLRLFNVSIESSGAGIDVSGGDAGNNTNMMIHSTQIINNDREAIVLNGVKGGSIIGTDFNGGNQGVGSIYLVDSDNIVITSNKQLAGGTFLASGIVLDHLSEYNSIIGNSLRGNAVASTAIFMNSDNNMAQGNSMFEYTSTDVIDNGSGNQIFGNTSDTAASNTSAFNFNSAAGQNLMVFDRDNNQVLFGDGTTNFAKFTVDGTLEFVGDAGLLGRNNDYIYQVTADTDVGAYFDLTHTRIEFRDEVPVPVMLVDVETATTTGVTVFNRLKIPQGTTPTPATCTNGDIFQDTDATSGQQLYACESGVWTLQGGGGAGDVTDVWDCSTGDCNTPTIESGERLDGGTATTDSTNEGILLPRASDCTGATSEGQLCWDTSDDALYVGDGSATGLVAGFSWVLQPQQAKLPTSNPMAINAGNNRWRGLFDDSTDECATWESQLRPYGGSALKAKILYSMDGVTSGTAAMEVSVDCISDGQDVDTETFGTADSLTATVPGTEGQMDTLTDTSLNGDGCSRDDLIIVRLCRDADGSDTASGGDLEMRKATIYE